MKIILLYVAMFVCSLFVSSPASALLMRTPVDGTFVVVDSVNDTQWADVNRFVDMTFASVEAEISAMSVANFAGVSDWRLATLAELNQLFDQILTVGDARQFDPVSTAALISINGRYNRIEVADTHAGASITYASSDPDSSTAVTKVPLATSYTDASPFPGIGAFVVASAAPIPEPSTLLLFGCGFAGLGMVGGKRFKR